MGSLERADLEKDIVAYAIEPLDKVKEYADMLDEWHEELSKRAIDVREFRSFLIDFINVTYNLEKSLEDLIKVIDKYYLKFRKED